MIFGGNREAVIENIQNAAEQGNFHAKVEVGDPVLTTEEKNEIVKRYISSRKTFRFRVKRSVARGVANAATYTLNRDTEIVGIEKAKGIKSGAVITSNHFGPVDNTVVRLLVRKLGKKRINIVSREENLAMDGLFGFLMNYADIIPITDNLHYLSRDFTKVLEELINKKEFVLIYPEKEMWFNYRKPRPPMPGAYHYAAKFGVPVISCFVEMRDTEDEESDGSKRVRYIMHVLDVMYPDPTKTVRENSTELCKRDYTLKKEAYERIYGRTLTYDFEESDIAGRKMEAVHEERA